ncbi:hypothetical protein HPB52_014231 [Rhipicephalus sanguineus]|uniref:Carboxylesterase type B domain-containing protein n=1 Tax=Rhipicephalus sanguineus TaxID=34632 RepID=A0A9D4YPY5_RHISA|nr:hypothetical protein HPB52_014231 [Rhipicephalus sanguineus]
MTREVAGTSRCYFPQDVATPQLGDFENPSVNAADAAESRPIHRSSTTYYQRPLYPQRFRTERPYRRPTNDYVERRTYTNEHVNVPVHVEGQRRLRPAPVYGVTGHISRYCDRSRIPRYERPPPWTQQPAGRTVLSSKKLAKLFTPSLQEQGLAGGMSHEEEEFHDVPRYFDEKFSVASMDMLLPHSSTHDSWKTAADGSSSAPFPGGHSTSTSPIGGAHVSPITRHYSRWTLEQQQADDEEYPTRHSQFGSSEMLQQCLGKHTLQFDRGSEQSTLSCVLLYGFFCTVVLAIVALLIIGGKSGGCFRYRLQIPSLEFTRMSENCLHSNVWTPSLGPPLKPVLVLFHGLHFENGGNQPRLFDGAKLAARENMVVVVPNYRLGLLGFFTDNTTDAPGNVAFLDQRMAMDWVRVCISSFGGDPNSVTLQGYGSGAASIGLQLLSPVPHWIQGQQTRKLLLQSGSPLEPFKGDTISLRDQIGAILVELGCKSDMRVSARPSCLLNSP